MSQEMDVLVAKVERNTTVIGSALDFISGLQAQLAAAGTDPVKLQQLADTIDASTNKLAAAVVANTPAASAPAPAPVPTADVLGAAPGAPATDETTVAPAEESAPAA